MERWVPRGPCLPWAFGLAGSNQTPSLRVAGSSALTWGSFQNGLSSGRFKPLRLGWSGLRGEGSLSDALLRLPPGALVPIHPGWAYRLVLSTTPHPQPWWPLQIKDTRSSLRKRRPWGWRHTPPPRDLCTFIPAACWPGRGWGCSSVCLFPELGGEGWGVPTTRLSSPGAALACLGDQGRPLGQLLGSGRGARKGFADFPPVAARVRKRLLPAVPKETNVFFGGEGLIKSLTLVGTRHILLVAKAHGWICFPFFSSALSRCRLPRVKSENGICSPCVTCMRICWFYFHL